MYENGQKSLLNVRKWPIIAEKCLIMSENRCKLSKFDQKSLKFV